MTRRIHPDIIIVTQSWVHSDARKYRRAYAALRWLDAINAPENQYQPLEKGDLRMSADMLEENRYNQRNHRMAWFWTRRGNGDIEADSWLEEGEHCANHLCMSF